MKRIVVKTRGNSLEFKFMLDGVNFRKAWGDASNPAHRAKMEYIATLVQADIESGDFICLDDYFDKLVVWDWKRVHKLISLKRANVTNETVMALLEKHQPKLNSPKHVQAWLDSMNIGNISKRRYLSAIRSVAPKICDGITYAANTKQAPNPFTIPEQEVILDAVLKREDYMKQLIPLWMYTGFRPGEARALHASDFKPDTRELTIVRSMTPNGRIKDTKTGVSRTIVLPSSICITSCLTNKEHRVFPELRHHSNWMKRTWKPLLTDLGITKDQRPYRLRHTAISNAVAKHPEHIADIAKAYGTSTRMIFNHYLGSVEQVREF